jgi:hypothetical protein
MKNKEGRRRFNMPDGEDGKPVKPSKPTDGVGEGE